ncbi:MAG: hypothetical protein PHQ43_10225 [Dehalococcoidales bacterium]|nr:hypothetical protein [Dehalococcoidales bacterium]
MKFDVSVEINLKDKEFMGQVRESAKSALKDIVIDVERESKENSPKRTGNNMRSITSDLGPGGELNLEELQGATYSTSGYGGYLETGTRFMAARPYMKPAADQNFTEEKVGERIKHYLGEA